MEEHFSKQLTTVNKNKEQMERLIAEEREKVNSIKEVTGNLVHNATEEQIVKTLEDKIKKIFLGGRKMEIRNSSLQMLTEIEKKINKYLKWMREYEDRGDEQRVKIEKK